MRFLDIHERISRAIFLLPEDEIIYEVTYCGDVMIETMIGKPLQPFDAGGFTLHVTTIDPKANLSMYELVKENGVYVLINTSRSPV